MSQRINHSDDLLQLVSFVIDNEEFGVDILRVQEIIRPMAITRVPNAPAFVEGVINLRGRIIPVVDLRTRFGLESNEQDHETRIMVVELTDKVIGFMVDEVREVIRVNRDVIEPPPELAIGIDTNYIRGVARLEERLLILLDLEEVLSEEEKQRAAETAKRAPSEKQAAA
ncbi:MAG: chemotaxis protein CheW [Candidatus Wenzhouxiangella sp. M2_3B_020]